MSSRDPDHTDLIDVGDIGAALEEDVTEAPDDISVPGDMFEGPAEEHSEGQTIAEIRDRFAAFALDLIFLYILYWPLMLVYRKITFGNVAGPIPAAGKQGLIFQGLFILIALIWFVIPELAFGGSLGKLFCRLAVRKRDGGYPSLMSVLIRNILRPVDMLLFPVLILTAAMEWTGWHRRIGDIVGGTLVVKRPGKFRKQYALSLDIIASATGRTFAFLVDLIFIGGFVLGYGLLLNPDKPVDSMILLVMFPPAIIFFFVLEEWTFKTSPGKWLLGLTICNEDGTVVDLPGVIIRTLWRPIDMNPFGFLTTLLSLRHQRPGDAAANTVVIKSGRELKGLVAILFWLGLALAVAYAGISNKDNFLSGGFKINFLPSVDFSQTKVLKSSTAPQNLQIKDFTFAEGDKKTPRRPSIYQPGEMVYILFDIDGFATKDESVWIQEDLSISYPDGNVGLKLENINDFHQRLESEGVIRFENNIQLPRNAEAGRYTVLLTLRDRLSNKELKEQRFFYVTPPDGLKKPADNVQTGDSKPAKRTEPSNSDETDTEKPNNSRTFD